MSNPRQICRKQKVSFVLSRMLQLDKSHTAILVFIRSASLEAVAKPLSLNKKKAPKLARLRNKRIVKIAHKTGLPTYVVDEKLQSGVDFGSRFYSAFKYVFQEGYRNVIAVGNDCISLNRHTIINAQQYLEQGKMVLGPAHDGGIYLMGISQQFFQELAFNKLAWQSALLFGQLQTIIQGSKHQVFILGAARDIDSIQELKAAFQTVKIVDAFLALIKQLLEQRFEQAPLIPIPILNKYSSLFSLRGPPE